MSELTARFNQRSNYDPTTMTRVAVQGGDEFGDLHGGGLRDVRERGRGQRIFIIVISLCALAGIGLGISLGLTKASVKDIVAPQDLSSTCSPGAVSTKRGYSTCESVCAQAECCRLPESHRKSCAESQADACEVFTTFCAILAFDHDGDGKVEIQEKVTVVAADPEIDVKCQWDRIASVDGYKACRDACKPGNCCLDEIETCRVTNPEMCAGYESCEILHVQQLVSVPPAVQSIPSVCSPESLESKEGYTMCKNACDPGECCMEPIEACKVKNPEMCSGYYQCDILHHSTPKSHPASVKSQVDTKCNTNALISDDGAKQCRDVCEPSACCFGDDDVLSCVGQSGDWCSQFAACGILDHIDDNDGIDSHAEAQVAIQEACVDTSPDGLIHCSNVCAPAHCCFDNSENCFDMGFDQLRCSHYDACGILYHNDKDPCTSVNPNPIAKDTSQEHLMQVAKQVEDACETAFDDVPDEQQSCLNICEDNLCCFSDNPDVNCLEEHGEMCIVYAACNNLLIGKHKPDVEAPKPLPNNNDHVEKSADFFEDLATKCDERNIGHVSGLTECFEMCKSHLCCFAHHMDENCYDDHPRECDDYMHCNTLIDPCDPPEDNPAIQQPATRTPPVVAPPSGPTQEEVYAACALSVVNESEEEFEKCHAMCSDHLCCYAPSGVKSNCMDTRGEDDCFKYNACSNLIEDFDNNPYEMPKSQPPDTDSIAVLCSDDFIQSNGEGDCEMMCVEKECCYLHEAGNCQVTDPEWCKNIELCLNVYDIKNEVMTDKLVMHCEAEWTTDCISICEERKCCLTRGIGSCAITDAKWCEPAQMCPVEDDEVTPPQLDLNDLITTCDQPNLRLKEGLAKCQSMCKAHLCCWDPDAGKNCYKDHPRECDDYDVCENLFLGHPTFDNPHSKDEIDELCLGTSITTETGLTACHAACSNYLCCFSPVGTKSNCEDTIGQDMCYTHAGCANLLVPDEKQVPDGKPVDGQTNDKRDNKLAEECSTDNMMNDGGIDDCLALCEERKCCGQNNGANCMVTAPGYCDNFDMCHGLDHLEEDEAVDLACAPNNVESEEGLEECRDKCDPYQCCWTSIEELNCSWQRPECTYYIEPCQILGGMLTGMEDTDEYDETEVYEPADYKEAIEKQCSESSLQTDYGLELCREHCTPHACCFLSDGDCGSNPEEECQMFTACANLHDFEGEVKEVQSAPDAIIQELDDVCSLEHLNRFGSSACKNHCDKRACCFTDNHPTNCYDEEKEWCGEYSACENMLGWTPPPPANSTPKETPISFMDEMFGFCSEEGIEKDNGNSCLAACTPNECCYIQGPRSCFEGNEKVCSDFLICNNLFGT
uniref:Uncharacterized protein n=1 Tax=Ditylum brightwellii TaxID=49249 RepID=A0A7S1ZEL4_9STRA|mmetsp:Transcript_30308/g.45080  ORF Transcript_30308/g.45080 Transcript_30308/m.45080 type:complete len:1338 (+) Transcript_30308:89-4102(+)